MILSLTVSGASTITCSMSVSSHVNSRSPIHQQENHIVFSLDMIFLKFSTGEYHPSAHCPRIHVQNSHRAGSPRITQEVVGDNFALVVSNRGTSMGDRLFIFDWKTGHKRLVR